MGPASCGVCDGWIRPDLGASIRGAFSGSAGVQGAQQKDSRALIRRADFARLGTCPPAISPETTIFTPRGSAKPVFGRLADSDRVAQLVEQPPFKR